MSVDWPLGSPLAPPPNNLAPPQFSKQVTDPFYTMKTDDEYNDILATMKTNATQAGYDLLRKLNRIKKDTTIELQLCTAESLTGGLIMSTLVDIPWLGNHKYGCFGVYDTDAKRTMIGVTTDDVYTHKCAAEMAVGILKNSNATIGLAVTGNAMPSNPNVDKLGEVFIGVAGYRKSNNKLEIICETQSINACKDDVLYRSLCDKWVHVINNSDQKNYNPRTDTASLSQLIRYYTTQAAFIFCKKFLNENVLIVPDFISKQKIQNNKSHINPRTFEEIHHLIPSNTYNHRTPIIYVNKKAKNHEGVFTNRYSRAALTGLNGGRGSRRKQKRTRKQKR